MSSDEKDNSKYILILGEPKKTLGEVCEILEKECPHPVEQISDLKAAVEFARDGRSFVALTSPETPEEIQLSVGFLKALKTQIRAKKVKVMMVTSFDSPAIQQKFQKLGVQDYISEPVALKSLEFKINLQLKSIEGKKEKSSNSSALKRSRDNQHDSQDSGGFASSKLECEYSEEIIGVSENIWIFDPKEKPKSVSGKIMVQLRGPDPNSGEWKYRGENKEGTSQWAWSWFKETLPESITQNGSHWIFTGNRPVHSAEYWKFVSANPELSFILDGETLAVKFALLSQEIIKIAKNSDCSDGLLKKVEALVRERSKMKGGNAQRPAGMSLSHMDEGLEDGLNYSKSGVESGSDESAEGFDYAEANGDDKESTETKRAVKKGSGINIGSMLEEFGFESEPTPSSVEQLGEEELDKALAEESRKNKEKEAFLKAEKAEKRRKRLKKEQAKKRKEREKAKKSRAKSKFSISGLLDPVDEEQSSADTGQDIEPTVSNPGQHSIEFSSELDSLGLSDSAIESNSEAISEPISETASELASEINQFDPPVELSPESSSETSPESYMEEDSSAASLTSPDSMGSPAFSACDEEQFNVNTLMEEYRNKVRSEGSKVLKIKLKKGRKIINPGPIILGLCEKLKNSNEYAPILKWVLEQTCTSLKSPWICLVSSEPSSRDKLQIRMSEGEIPYEISAQTFALPDDGGITDGYLVSKPCPYFVQPIDDLDSLRSFLIVGRLDSSEGFSEMERDFLETIAESLGDWIFSIDLTDLNNAGEDNVKNALDEDSEGFAA